MVVCDCVTGRMTTTWHTHTHIRTNTYTHKKKNGNDQPSANDFTALAPCQFTVTKLSRVMTPQTFHWYLHFVVHYAIEIYLTSVMCQQHHWTCFPTLRLLYIPVNNISKPLYNTYATLHARYTVYGIRETSKGSDNTHTYIYQELLSGFPGNSAFKLPRASFQPTSEVRTNHII